MSFEGYYQLLCKKGHYWERNYYDCMLDNNIEKCFICKSNISWYNLVDLTNGSFDDKGRHIDGYKKLKIKKQLKCNKCGSILETIYVIPYVTPKEK